MMNRRLCILKMNHEFGADGRADFLVLTDWSGSLSFPKIHAWLITVTFETDLDFDLNDLNATECT